MLFVSILMAIDNFITLHSGSYAYEPIAIALWYVYIVTVAIRIKKEAQGFEAIAADPAYKAAHGNELP